MPALESSGSHISGSTSIPTSISQMPGRLDHTRCHSLGACLHRYRHSSMDLEHRSTIGFWLGKLDRRILMGVGRTGAVGQQSGSKEKVSK